MANGGPPVSFDDIIQEGRRKRAAEQLAQEIFGKKGRSSAPPTGPKAGLGGSLASRVGVVKRNSPSPRAAPIRTPRDNRPTPLARANTDNQTRRRTSPGPPDLGSASRRNAPAKETSANGGGELSIKGAAGPYIVVAQNFAPGTTAADIESVMMSVGGQMTDCKLVASNPTVIAEMSFVEKSGAEKVIETFNGKKADGRPLYVYWKTSTSATPKSNTSSSRREQAPVPELGASEGDDVVMEVDENAESREAQNRLREERRSHDDRAPRDAYPTGPRNYQAEMDRYDDRQVRRPQSHYGGFGPGGGYGYGSRGGWYGGYDRRYAGGRNWR